MCVSWRSAVAALAVTVCVALLLLALLGSGTLGVTVESPARLVSDPAASAVALSTRVCVAAEANGDPLV